jgi:hypothetical protein
MPSEAAVRDIWIIGLAVLGVVTVVVAVLLTLILMTARRIHAGAAAIWTAGQKVANNTIHLALLLQTNHLAGRILGAAVATAGAVAAVERHAAACPHCPICATDAAKRWRQP